MPKQNKICQPNKNFSSIFFLDLVASIRCIECISMCIFGGVQRFWVAWGLCSISLSLWNKIRRVKSLASLANHEYHQSSLPLEGVASLPCLPRVPPVFLASRGCRQSSLPRKCAASLFTSQECRQPFSSSKSVAGSLSPIMLCTPPCFAHHHVNELFSVDYIWSTHSVDYLLIAFTFPNAISFVIYFYFYLYFNGNFSFRLQITN